MKPFDIEKAKAGHPVCTRDGRKARIICFDRIFYYEGYDYPIVAMVNNKGNESVHAYTKDGLLIGGKERDYDLMMAFEKKTGWINIYPSQYKEKVAMTGSYAYKTQKEAKECANSDCIATIQINWEE